MEQLENVIINSMTTFVAYSKPNGYQEPDRHYTIQQRLSNTFSCQNWFYTVHHNFQLLSCSLCSKFFSSVHTQQSFSSAAMWQAFGKEKDK
jgi:hypothetical protein